MSCEIALCGFQDMCSSTLWCTRKWNNLLVGKAGFPRGIESIEKVLNFEIGFQDLEKVLNLTKMYIRYGKSMEILNGKEILHIWAEFTKVKALMQCYAMCKIEFHD